MSEEQIGAAEQPDVAPESGAVHRQEWGAESRSERLRSLRDTLRAARQGQLSVRLPEAPADDVLMAEVTLAFNSLMEQNERVVGELARVSRAVAERGDIAQRASIAPLDGDWLVAVDAVNDMIAAAAHPTRQATRVLRLIAAGDLSHAADSHFDGHQVEGELAGLGHAVNDLVARLRTVTTELATVVREFGERGNLSIRASSEGLTGTWRELIGLVNTVSSTLGDQVRDITMVSTAIAEGDLSQKITIDTRGELLELKNAVNTTVDQLRAFSAEVIRVAREVGFEGKLGGQAQVPGVSGVWRDLTDSVNRLAGNLTSQVRNIAQVTTAVANGDLSKKITVEAKGEILELKDTVNSMVERLRMFAAEVTRVAREVGTEGQLGGQARVSGVTGTWSDLTDNVNIMARNLTDQVRGISRVVTAVANGELNKRLVLVAKGEIATLADTINDMTDTLRTFAEQVTSVAREVGIEGKLGGQALVPGAAGTWRDLVDNVNQLAGNLTTQVRSISNVAAAVTKGDLTRTIDVEAQGEVLGLKDTINQMIANLRDTTSSNKEQDWLKTNLAKFSGMMQGQRSLESLARLVMSELTPVVSAQLGTFFVVDNETSELRLLASYGYVRRKHLSNRFALGESLVGQAALERKMIVVKNVPDDYVGIVSSLGEAPPKNLAIVPILFEGTVRGVIELGSFEPFHPIHLTFLDQLALSIGVVSNMISASRRTEELLEQLKRSNVELETRSGELEEKARLLETRNREIAEASADLEEKAKQLALVSKYKSEFLANMSHELRTPLNSVIILATLLAENAEGKLSDEQIEWARTIHSSGQDLLQLINQILDLSKIEAGRMQVVRRRVPLGELRDYLEKHFNPIAKQKGIRFDVSIAPDAPFSVTTDSQRLQQILKNLLSNAFKFTDTGSVTARIAIDRDTARFSNLSLKRAVGALSFAITDTGIGISPDKQQIIFEAFQQADASTSRTYGGTGLGLTISRELARLLGGEIQLRSTPGAGSTFTLYLPVGREDFEPAPEGSGFESTHAEDAVEPSHAVAPVTEAAPLPAAGERQPKPREAPPAIEGEEPTPKRPFKGVDLGGATILVVDDDPRSLFAVATLLERHNAVVVPATNAEEAFDRLKEDADVGLVLMDIMMPGVDGLEATRRLREDRRYEKLPVIALTAKAMPGDRDGALEAGCDDFIAKPVDKRELLAVLERWLKREPSESPA